jgi:histone-binding protein RBBP4
VDIKVKIVHEGEIHRARYMPQNPVSTFSLLLTLKSIVYFLSVDKFIIATKSTSSTVLVFDYSKHSSMPTDSICRPQHRCHGHTSDGYGIAWSPFQAGKQLFQFYQTIAFFSRFIKGHLLSAAADKTICLWDTKVPDIDVHPLQIFSEHKAGVEDVCWHAHQCDIFASVGDDKKLCLWDVRQGMTPVSHCEAHDGDANCVSFSPMDEFSLATGGADGAVKLWDCRNLSASLHVCQGHTEGVYQVQWSPFKRDLLASSGEDRRIFLWDLDRVGREQTPEESQDGPPELLFIHGGHTAKVKIKSMMQMISVHCLFDRFSISIGMQTRNGFLLVWQKIM